MTIADRLDDMAARYPEHASQIRAAQGAAEALEMKLAGAAGLSRIGLEGRLRAAWEDGDR
ncbi:MAG: hypothetical protein ACRDFZ_05400 [Candidatus Limnocylindria bacterium]